MDLSGSIQFDAARAAVWELLGDFEGLARCGAAIQSIERLDATHGRVKVRIGSGFLSTTVPVDVELVDMQPGERVVLRAVGAGAGTRVEAVGELRLGGPAEGPTTVDYVGSVELSGSFAGLGTRMLENDRGQVLDQTLECVRARLAAAG